MEIKQVEEGFGRVCNFKIISLGMLQRITEKEVRFYTSIMKLAKWRCYGLRFQRGNRSDGKNPFRNKSVPV